MRIANYKFWTGWWCTSHPMGENVPDGNARRKCWSCGAPGGPTPEPARYPIKIDCNDAMDVIDTLNDALAEYNLQFEDDGQVHDGYMLLRL